MKDGQKGEREGVQERADYPLTSDLRAEADTAPLVSLLVGAGVQVKEVRRGKASLEKVFVTLIEEEP